jgi:aminomethyltransferase
MPIWYEGITQEVMAVREGAGLFDISHMGRAIFRGKDSGKYLDILTTNEISSLEPLQARYTLMCDERGGILDDMIVCRLGEDSFMVVWNAVNSEKNFRWAGVYKWEWNVEVDLQTEKSFMLAVQGPSAQRVLQPLCDAEIGGIKRFRGAKCKVSGTECLVTRTGYTGEDGFEIISNDTGKAEKVWTDVLSSGAVPAGLGARDVLRLEAGLPLYGHDISEEHNPIEARLEFAVKLEKPEFIGKDALARIAQEKVKFKRTGIRMVDRGIPREGFKVSSGGMEIGRVTSGTYSPTVKAGIAMGYLMGELPCSAEVLVDIRGRESKGIISDTPFYDEAKFGFKRRVPA